MENGESVEEGALRETVEEANANIEILSLHTLYSVVHVNQVYMIFLARLKDVDFYPGPESLETALFQHSDIPWNELAFSSVRFCLEMYARDFPKFPDLPYMGSIKKK